MSSGTLAPAPWFTGFDDAGRIIQGGKLFTYEAGTTTKVATYTDVALAVPHTNPIVLDGAGRTTIYLTPGTAYKFVLSPPSDTDPPTAPIRTQDNIGATPASASNQDVLGTAGEDITAEEVVYLSQGDGGRTGGLWYLASAADDYSSTVPIVGFAVASSATGEALVARLGGQIENAGPLTPGAPQYVDVTPGAITETAPSKARQVGVADTPTRIVIATAAAGGGATVLEVQVFS